MADHDQNGGGLPAETHQERKKLRKLGKSMPKGRRTREALLSACRKNRENLQTAIKRVRAETYAVTGSRSLPALVSAKLAFCTMSFASIAQLVPANRAVAKIARRMPFFPGDNFRGWGMAVSIEDRRGLKALRATLDASIAVGGEVTEDELDQAIAARSRDLIRKGISP